MEEAVSLLTSHHGLMALGSVTLSVSMMLGLISYLAYKASQPPQAELQTASKR